MASHLTRFYSLLFTLCTSTAALWRMHTHQQGPRDITLVFSGGDAGPAQAPHVSFAHPHEAGSKRTRDHHGGRTHTIRPLPSSTWTHERRMSTQLVIESLSQLVIEHPIRQPEPLPLLDLVCGGFTSAIP